MTKLTNIFATAAIAAIAAAPALAQSTSGQTADPFVSTQTGVEIAATSTGLTAAALGGVTLVLVGAIVFVLDSDGNTVTTTSR